MRDRLQEIESLFDQVREAFLKERQSLEQGDVTNAANESERGFLLFESATKMLVEEVKTAGKIDLDTGARVRNRVDRIYLKALELARLRTENYRMGIRMATMIALCGQPPKQAH